MEHDIFNFNELPKEIKIKILLNLSARDLKIYSRTNKEALNICSDLYIWKKLAKNKMNIDERDFIDYDKDKINPIDRYIELKKIHDKNAKKIIYNTMISDYDEYKNNGGTRNFFDYIINQKLNLFIKAYPECYGLFMNN